MVMGSLRVRNPSEKTKKNSHLMLSAYPSVQFLKFDDKKKIEFLHTCPFDDGAVYRSKYKYASD